MGSKTNSGFTIIETMLFLGVSGALAIAILVGVNSSINQQRYRDAVNSLRSFIQEQYSNVENTNNGRSGAEACNQLAAVRPGGAGVVSEPRGTSECVLLGKYIAFDTSGQKAVVSDVIAYEISANPRANDIEDVSLNYKVQTYSIDPQTYDVAWGARVTKKGGSVAPYTIMIIRSPRSGALMTFTAQARVSPQDIVSAANNKAGLVMCVDTSVLQISNRPLGVQIKPYNVGPSGVGVPEEQEGVCG